MPPKIHVVAGILFNECGEFLLSSRPEGKPYAGYWEFAGGKVEAGETEFAALQNNANTVIRNIAEKEKYDLIVQEAVFVTQQYDITDRVIKLLDEMK